MNTEQIFAMHIADFEKPLFARTSPICFIPQSISPGAMI